MKNRLSTQSENLRIYEKQRQEAVKNRDVALLKFYAEVDKFNAELIKQGKAKIIPIITK